MCFSLGRVGTSPMAESKRFIKKNQMGKGGLHFQETDPLKAQSESGG